MASSTSRSFYVDSLILKSPDRFQSATSPPPVARSARLEQVHHDMFVVGEPSSVAIGRGIAEFSRKAPPQSTSDSLPLHDNRHHHQHQQQQKQQQQIGYGATTRRSAPYLMPMYRRSLNASPTTAAAVPTMSPTLMHPSLQLLHGLSLLQLARMHQQQQGRLQHHQQQHFLPVVPTNASCHSTEITRGAAASSTTACLSPLCSISRPSLFLSSSGNAVAAGLPSADRVVGPRDGVPSATTLTSRTPMTPTTSDDVKPFDGTTRPEQDAESMMARMMMMQAARQQLPSAYRRIYQPQFDLPIASHTRRDRSAAGWVDSSRDLNDFGASFQRGK